MHRIAYYVASAISQLELVGEMALGLLLREYGITGNPELEMMKVISRVSPDHPQLMAVPSQRLQPGLA